MSSTEQLVEYGLPQGYDESDTPAERAHAAYAREKAGRERALDLAYEAYVAGRVGMGNVFTLAHRHIRMKAATQHNLRHLRSDNNVETVDDHLQEFLAEILPRIEQKKVTGKLSFYLNSAFRLHFIKATEGMKEEWDWRRFLASRSIVDSEGNTLSPADVHATEWNSEVSRDDADPAEAIMSDTDREVETVDIDNKFGPKLSKRPAPVRDISMRAQDAAFRRFEQEHRDDIYGRIVRSLKSDADRKGKHLAHYLGVSESTISRARSYIEREIHRLAVQIQQQSESTGQ